MTEEKDNTVFIGMKPFMNYVTAVVVQFKMQEEVIVSARGKFISRAVDVVEVARRTFLKDENIQIKDIKISSQQKSLTTEHAEDTEVFGQAVDLTKPACKASFSAVFIIVHKANYIDLRRYRRHWLLDYL